VFVNPRSKLVLVHTSVDAGLDTSELIALWSDVTRQLGPSRP
jgi:hypothetical protein